MDLPYGFAVWRGSRDANDWNLEPLLSLDQRTDHRETKASSMVRAFLYSRKAAIARFESNSLLRWPCPIMNAILSAKNRRASAGSSISLLRSRKSHAIHFASSNSP